MAGIECARHFESKERGSKRKSAEGHDADFFPCVT